MVTEGENVERVMDALGTGRRREILALLREGALPVGEIAGRLPISRPAVSKHLRVLEEAGLVEFSSVGTRNIFRLRSSGFDMARAYVGDFWEEALECFRRAVEEAANQVECEDNKSAVAEPQR